ncbi:DUF397 domain-containing protein [Streptomyces xinghaiensis]|uniref:DUF397 domain-containing protein n=1 Tax=Streptomyces xinghaiensis TaxID=1038928 RepID=A0A3R7FE99_9ACTN|nr:MULTISPECIES: DUF397 domain-containing protein [Streptomyces]PQM22287.1 DUF397 domain-containing protein [Streptomyces xinghaiensis]RKM95540.1 DUF397 domain-containing protein [Streptomyces xinghaiensis]RNC73126.1 DUF397 domain-containing protein [Streptomyces xinghaiensis]
MSVLNWQKSTFSPEASSCVYVASAPDGALWLRESDEPEAVLRTTSGALRALIRGVKAGQFEVGRPVS